MGRLSSRRSAKSPTDQAIRIALGLFLLSGAVSGTSASFNASATNPAATIASDALYPPGALTAAGAGNNVTLTAASAGSMGSGATTFGHRFRTANVGIESGVRDGQDPPACTSATTFTSTVASTTNAVITTTHSSVATATNAGSWQCYMVDTQYPQGASPLWFSQTANANQVAVVQLGNVTTSVQFVNGNGSAGTLGTGDSIVFTYSQPITTSTGPTSTTWTGSAFTGNAICSKSGQELNFGRTGTSPTCANAETNWVGTFTPTIGSSNSSWDTTWTWSSCPVAGQCRTLTALLGTSRGTTATTTISLSTGLTPTTVAGKLTSATGAIAMCSTANTAAIACQPIPYGTV